jgi:hypothetical protein
MSLSNATKNQRDTVSRLMQSYVSFEMLSKRYFQTSKIWHSISLVIVSATTQQPALLVVAAPFVMDAVYGLWILSTIFSKEEDSGLLEEKQVKKQYNDRVPTILSQTKMTKKVFTKGWKFNLFNE